MWTAFDYMYRDAGNFKAFGTIVLKGYLSTGDQEIVCTSLDGGEFFVAEQVGVPALYDDLYKWSAGPTRFRPLLAHFHRISRIKLSSGERCRRL